MKIFFDTEFITIKDKILLLSIGLIKEDNSTYYAELGSTDRTLADDWVKENVIPYLTGPIKSRDQIALDLIKFCGSDCEFWSYFGLFDMKLLRELFDGMYSWPLNWSEHVYDIMKLYGNKDMPIQTSIKHHALNDALWVKEAYDLLSI